MVSACDAGSAVFWVADCGDDAADDAGAVGDDDSTVLEPLELPSLAEEALSDEAVLGATGVGRSARESRFKVVGIGVLVPPVPLDNSVACDDADLVALGPSEVLDVFPPLTPVFV
ncbi:hypothetical protein [Mycobacterium sp. GA-1841]|uniref:hypothetical protein n=1 Tax=Mycobacterium sp. GA-1841 TaxID=1834154 RepID=UPI001115A7F2|nr:hypothetical protein [Mycobacterium sp. GA-1841]